MNRSIIAGIVATAIGVGFTTQAMAEPRGHHRGYHPHVTYQQWRDRNHDGRVDWRDSRHRGHRHGWDRNRDGRVDWRDRRGQGYGYGWRDRNHDGRVDWRDRRAPSYYWGDFFGRR